MARCFYKDSLCFERRDGTPELHRPGQKRVVGCVLKPSTPDDPPWSVEHLLHSQQQLAKPNTLAAPCPPDIKYGVRVTRK